MPLVMGKDATRPLGLEAILELALRGELTEADARRLHALGPEAVAWFALAMASRVTELEAAGAMDLRRNNLTVFLVVILSATKDLPRDSREILRCAQNDSNAD